MRKGDSILSFESFAGFLDDKEIRELGMEIGRLKRPREVATQTGVEGPLVFRPPEEEQYAERNSPGGNGGRQRRVPSLRRKITALHVVGDDEVELRSLFKNDNKDEFAEASLSDEPFDDSVGRGGTSPSPLLSPGSMGSPG